jgi:hypothetical protein
VLTSFANEAARQTVLKNIPAMPPYQLTFVMTGRDDEYMADFRYRATTTIEYIAAAAHRIRRERDVAILFVDWGSASPLHTTFSLTSRAAALTRFVHVSPSTVSDLTGDVKTFNTALAANIGLRRAESEWIVLTSADTLISDASLLNLLRLLDGSSDLGCDPKRAYLLIPRQHVPWQFVQRMPTVQAWDRYILLSAGEAIKDPHPLSISAGAGGLLLSRSMWHHVRGVDERFVGWGLSDVDLGLRISQECPWFNLSGLGVQMLHMEHVPHQGQRVAAVHTSQNAIVARSATVASNDDRWGARDLSLPIVKAEHTSHGVVAANIATHSNSDNMRSFHQDELIRELNDPDLRRQIMRAIHSARSGGIDNPITKTSLAALFFLAWFARRNLPMRYIDFQVTDSLAALVVANAAPHSEIYGLSVQPTRWPYPQVPIAELCKANGHRGYMRFVAGERSTNFQRLQASFIGECSFDLAYLQNCSALNNEAIHHAFDHVAPAGAIVLHDDTVDTFQKSWNELSTKYPHNIYICAKECPVGVVCVCDKHSSIARAPTKIEIPAVPPRSFHKGLERARLAIHIRRRLTPFVQPRRYFDIANRFLTLFKV